MLTLLVVLVLTGCGKEEVEGARVISTPTPVAAQQEGILTEKVEPEVEVTPTTAPQVEILPTAEELLQNGSKMGNSKYKMTFAFSIVSEDVLQNLAASVTSENSTYENIQYDKTIIAITMDGYTEEDVTETYTVDGENNMRTKYTHDMTDDSWIKSTFVHIEEDGKTLLDDIKNFKDTTVTSDDNYYYVTGKMEQLEQSDALGESIGDLGLPEDTVVSADFVLSYSKETKTPKVGKITVHFEVGPQDGYTMTVKDMVIEGEYLDTPIIIPDHVLNCEDCDNDSYYDDDYNFDYGESSRLIEVNKPTESELVAVKDLPKNWSSIYSEHTSAVGSFETWDDITGREYIIYLGSKNGWYYDQSYDYIACVAVDNPNVYSEGPAYEAEYMRGDVEVSAGAEAIAKYLLDCDYTGEVTTSDVVQVVCNGRPCYILKVDEWDDEREYVILQDIGINRFIEIEVYSHDMQMSDADVATMFALNVDVTVLK